MHTLISIEDLSREKILSILHRAQEFKRQRPEPFLQGRVMGSCFFEPSTRTRLSFETAMKRLGGDVVGFADGSCSSAAKGETLYDSMKVIGRYVDLIVLRHPLEGAARLAAEATDTPVINAGDGAHHHPTQTVTDLFTMQESQGKLEGLHVTLAGDLRYGRTTHSLAQAAAQFNMRLYFVAPTGLEMPDRMCDHLRQQGVYYSFHRQLEEVIGKSDILYCTRLQAERIPHPIDAKFCQVTPDLLQGAKESMKILHPLPRRGELPIEIDQSPHAHYFDQAHNGLFVRQAILEALLHDDDDNRN